MNKKTIKNAILVLSFIFLSFFLSFSLGYFGFSVKNYLTNSAETYLSESSHLYAGTFQLKLTDQLAMLESQCRYFSNVDMTNYNQMKKTIKSTKGIGEFKRIAVADSSGMTLNYDGLSSGNIFMTDYFKKAMNTNTPQISQDLTKDEDGQNVLVLAVPIIQDNKAVGVITGTFNYSILNQLLDINFFNGIGSTYVISSTGQVIVSTHGKSQLSYGFNIFNLIQSNNPSDSTIISNLTKDINSNKSNLIKFKLNDEMQLCAYNPIGVNDWYILSIVPLNSFTSQIKKITINGSIVILLIIITLFILIFLCYGSIVNTIKFRNDANRYNIANSQQSNIIIEILFKDNLVEFSGNTAFFFGKTVTSLTLEEFTAYYDFIHDEDKAIVKHLRESIKEKEINYTTEIRFKDHNDEYNWYRLSSTLIFDKSENPEKLIISMENVNAQILHEKELQHIAETDNLSGLLNKNFFEKRVSRFLATASENQTYAMFVIDLDNFKQTNDTLGHSMGDKAIRDSANKISLIFSEQDFIGRIGGDEFCVLLCFKNDISEEAAKKIINQKGEKLRSILKETYSYNEKSVTITSSVGIAIFPYDGTDYSELFKHADYALYQVKNNGKNNYQIYTPDLPEIGESIYENIK